MASTEFSGPLIVGGPMTSLPAGLYSSAPVLDYNPDAGPSLFYQGNGTLDPRYLLLKDRLNGFTGIQPSFRDMTMFESVDVVPSAYGTARVCSAQHIVSGTAMTLAAASGNVGASYNIPIQPTQGALAGTVVTAPMVLDFGFAFGQTTAGSNIVTVTDSTQFVIGMPLILSWGIPITVQIVYVTGLPSATTITISSNALVTAVNQAIGTGNAWPGGLLGNLLSTYHMPYFAGGPGLFFDPSQALARGLSVTASGGTGGTITVSGWDVYWQPMTETITVTAGAVTVYGKKAFKAISKVVPNFTDGTNNYSVGTSDVFGFAFRSNRWELTDMAWASGSVTGNAGWTVYNLPTLGDVRGTFQASAIGGGTGWSATTSNGAISGHAMAGNRLTMFQTVSLANMLQATPANATSLFGAIQT